MKRGDWQTRRFDMIDLIQQESMYVAQKFVDLLSKDNVQTSRALQNAEAIYSAKTIAETLPLAWNKLISKPDMLFVDLFSKTIEKICGHKPEIEKIKLF